MPTEKEKADQLAKDTQAQAQRQAQRQGKMAEEESSGPHSINEPPGSDVTPAPEPEPQKASPTPAPPVRHDDKADKKDEGKGQGRK